MITVFTPTYNRAALLPMLYASLRRQTCRDFEWLVVDDGSQDGTKALLEGWMAAENDFPIRYFYQENGGKHRAANRGAALAAGDWFFPVDSDDRLTDDAVERVTAWTADIAGLDGFAGVSGLKADQDGAISGGSPKLGPGGYVDATNLQRGRYRLGGEKAEVYRSELLRRYPFPEFEGERFITESVVWDEIAAAGYKLRWFGAVIYRFEYRHDGLTAQAQSEEKKAAQRLQNPRGYACRVQQQLRLGGLRNRVSAIGGWWQMARLRGDSPRTIAAFLHTPRPIIAAVALLFRLREGRRA